VTGATIILQAAAWAAKDGESRKWNLLCSQPSPYEEDQREHQGSRSEIEPRHRIVARSGSKVRRFSLIADGADALGIRRALP
jgi:hypothetical protein